MLIRNIFLLFMRQLGKVGRQNSLCSTFAFKIAMVISIYQREKNLVKHM